MKKMFDLLNVFNIFESMNIQQDFRVGHRLPNWLLFWNAKLNFESWTASDSVLWFKINDDWPSLTHKLYFRFEVQQSHRLQINIVFDESRASGVCLDEKHIFKILITMNLLVTIFLKRTVQFEGDYMMIC